MLTRNLSVTDPSLMRIHSTLVRLVTFLCLGSCLLLLLCGGAQAAEKPNIVLIFADDLGWRDTGFSGSDYYETPNLDRLAKQGMVFTQAYAAAGNCAPSRACLLSGQYTPRHSVYAVGNTKRGPVELMRMLPVPNKSGLPADDLTMGKALKAAGYVTGMFGKWHLSGKTGSKPEDHFDVVKVAGHTWRDKTGDPKGIFAITEAACEFMEENRDRPFFVYMPHYAVHTPIQARPETVAGFKQKTPGEIHNSPLFAGCIAELDTGVGMVVQKLAELGLEENTLVLFTSDNGGTATVQEPLRGKKGGYYEGGIREPMIVRWPAVVKPGTTCDVPVISVDFYPTFLAAAGAKPPADHPLDGASLLPLLQGKPALEREAIFWHFPGYLNGPVPRGRDPVFRTRPVSVIRKGDWKLHLYHEEWQLDGGREKLATNNAVELYNIAEDAGERNNVATSNLKKRDELLDDLLTWIEETPAPLPTEPNPKYRPKGKR
jgi:arylsulfatase A-like enzyme